MTPGWLLCGRFWVDEADGVRELHAGLPWFLDDMRPQGFMGRTFAHTHPALGLAADPRHWSADDALKALASAGLPAARPQVFFISNRLFLESERFDRTAAGRIGMVSLQVYDAQYVGQEDNWAATGRMEARSLLRSQEAAHLRLLEAYGVLIANTDRITAIFPCYWMTTTGSCRPPTTCCPCCTRRWAANWCRATLPPARCNPAPRRSISGRKPRNWPSASGKPPRRTHGFRQVSGRWQQTTCKRCARCNAFVQASPRGFKHQKWRLCMLHGR